MTSTPVPAPAMVVADKRTGEVLPVGPQFDLQRYLTQLQSPEQLKAQQQLAHVYDVACAALIGPNDVQREGNREFKKKSAWRKLARHFTISVTAEQQDVRFLDLPDGEWMMVAKARAIGPWGQVWEDVGACGSDEETGFRRITFADAVGTAMTRASNRAVSNLIAMGEVSAEEMQGKGDGANGSEERQPRPAAERKMPIGEHKGKLLGEIPTEALEKALLWATDPAEPKRVDRYASFSQALGEVLRGRKPPEEQEEQPTLPLDGAGTGTPGEAGKATSPATATSESTTTTPSTPTTSQPPAPDDPRIPRMPQAVKVFQPPDPAHRCTAVQVTMFTAKVESSNLTDSEKLAAYKWLAEYATKDGMKEQLDWLDSVRERRDKGVNVNAAFEEQKAEQLKQLKKDEPDPQAPPDDDDLPF